MASKKRQCNMLGVVVIICNASYRSYRTFDPGLLTVIWEILRIHLSRYLKSSLVVWLTWVCWRLGFTAKCSPFQQSSALLCVFVFCNQCKHMSQSSLKFKRRKIVPFKLMDFSVWNVCVKSFLDWWNRPKTVSMVWLHAEKSCDSALMDYQHKALSNPAGFDVLYQTKV